MTDAKHTPGLWEVGRTDMRSYLGDGTPVHYVYRGDAETAATRIRIVPMPGRDVDPTDDALRIVACVNALRGLDVANVEALLDAVRAESESLYNDKIPIAEHSRRELARSRASDALRDSIRAGGGQ